MGIKFSGSDAGGFRFGFSGATSAAGGSEGSAAPKRWGGCARLLAVAYTHMTLPTITDG